MFKSQHNSGNILIDILQYGFNPVSSLSREGIQDMNKTYTHPIPSTKNETASFTDAEKKVWDIKLQLVRTISSFQLEKDKDYLASITDILFNLKEIVQIQFSGVLPKNVFAQDLFLKSICLIDTSELDNLCVEYVDLTVKKLSIETRMLLCSLSTESGVKLATSYPDQVTIDYLKKTKITTRISSGDLQKITGEAKFPMKICGNEDSEMDLFNFELIRQLSNMGRKFVFFSCRFQSKQNLMKKLPEEDFSWVQDLSRISSNLDKKVILVEGFDLETVRTVLEWIEKDRIVFIQDAEKIFSQILESINLNKLFNHKELILSADWTNLHWLDWDYCTELQLSSYDQPKLGQYEALWTVWTSKTPQITNQHWQGISHDLLNLQKRRSYQYNQKIAIETSQIDSMITWGIGLNQAIRLTENIPILDNISKEEQQILQHMGLVEGQKLLDLPINLAIMSDSGNGQIEDLRAVAKILQHQKISNQVSFYIVPSSSVVKLQAEREGLDKIVKNAGAFWEMSVDDIFVKINRKAAVAQRCLTTSGHIFYNQQQQMMVHLVSPATLSVSAIFGKITEPSWFLS